MDSFNTLDILSDKKVLYAEDEKGIRQNITEVLELFFLKVVEVRDGLQQLELCQTTYNTI